MTSTLKDQQDVAVTIYNSNIGLVKDTRLIDVKPGIVELMFMDVAAKIDPTSVHIRSLTEGDGLSILEQNYEYDLLSPQKLLEKYVGKTVYLATVDPETKKEEIVEAVLLSTQGGNIFKIGDKISIGHPGRILLSRIPENLMAQPTLVWLLENRSSRPQKVEASYLTTGINWKADYVAVFESIRHTNRYHRLGDPRQQERGHLPQCASEAGGGRYPPRSARGPHGQNGRQDSGERSRPSIQGRSLFRISPLYPGPEDHDQGQPDQADDASRCEPGPRGEALHLLRRSTILLFAL